MDGPGFRIVRTIHQALDARMNHRTRAHGARFNCNKQLTLSQTMVAQGRSGFAQRYDLGVRGRIGIRNILVPSSSNNFSLTNHDSPDRDFSHFQGALRAA